MRYFEESKMKRMRQWAWCNSMHEFRLLPSRMWYVFGCESEASDLTPDKSFCAAASECITEPTARAKSIFIWVQLLSLQLLTKVPPLRHQMWGFSSLCACARICTFACDCVRVNVCVCLWGKRWIDFHKMASGRHRSHNCPELSIEK